ncbi:hypothetical protein AB6A40_009181, partial [Gnathostoma spinigerum]
MDATVRSPVRIRFRIFISNSREQHSEGSFLCAPRNSIIHQHFLTAQRNEFQALLSRNRRKGRMPMNAEHLDAFASVLSEKLKTPWIEQTFQKRECIKFIAADGSDRCGCGRPSSAHSAVALSRFTTMSSFAEEDTAKNVRSQHWNIAQHTEASPTDAFGTLEFTGGAHAHKAHYVRLGYDSDPSDIMYLMEKVWNLDPPRLVITVHGGISNFEVQDKLGRVFREGLLRAAQTTGAWIITAGIDSGVVRHVAIALDEAGISARYVLHTGKPFL